ncbi:MAG TPA: DUF1684 domain-containing protein [Vicinamibacterales bacterium]
MPLPRSAVLLLTAALAACAPSPVEDEAAFVRETEAFRAAKDEAFRQPGSPVPPDRQDVFLPLAYYPPSLEYQVPASLRIAEEQPVTQMPTSTGQMRTMRMVGTLEFTLNGQPLSLGAFVDANAESVDRLFVPFTDQTSGTETYQAGRYLDLDRTRTGIYVIDFNRAYNPYCYYDASYDCPFPPRSNRLDVAIRAGERVRAEALASAEPAR